MLRHLIATYNSNIIETATRYLSHRLHGTGIFTYMKTIEKIKRYIYTKIPTGIHHGLLMVFGCSVISPIFSTLNNMGDHFAGMTFGPPRNGNSGDTVFEQLKDRRPKRPEWEHPFRQRCRLATGISEIPIGNQHC